MLAALAHPGHIVCYAPGDLLPCRLNYLLKIIINYCQRINLEVIIYNANEVKKQKKNNPYNFFIKNGWYEI
ncbi:hypothetical protein C5467_00280 [Photorhabdus khanii subsp. guanajuatensis]|uniref:Uncharacterized protein n=1 Tax=Photorhabdus khanii subsp. guanajuatensis TaxID=2100166 RepID=A0A4R4K8Y3_9GAMM|nr:hypothetical protein C5467_00280 [Photorhabdus khanii subsp. guanajuatensis]